MSDHRNQGYIVGATVRQFHHTGYDDAIITAVHDNGALEVKLDGKAYGWSVPTCIPVKNIK